MRKILPLRRPRGILTSSFFVFAAMVLANAITLSATAQTISMAAVGPSSLDFGQNRLGTESNPLPVILANAGSDPLAITEIARSGDFAAMYDCPNTLPPGKECHIFVSFKPTAVGLRTGKLTISNGAGTQIVLLRGEGDLDEAHIRGLQQGLDEAH